MNWLTLLWVLVPGVASVVFHRLIAVSWDNVNVYLKRRPSRYARALARIKAMEIDCEIKDAAGDLVHPPSGQTMRDWNPVDSRGVPLEGYAKNVAIRAQTRRNAEERRANAEAARKVKMLTATDAYGRPLYNEGLEKDIYEQIAQLNARQLEALTVNVGPAMWIREGDMPSIPTISTYSTGPR